MEKELLSLDVQKSISKSAELQYVSPDGYRNKNKIINIIFHLFLKSSSLQSKAIYLASPYV